MKQQTLGGFERYGKTTRRARRERILMQVVSLPSRRLFMNRSYPKRIVCLTEEPTEVLYALGEQDRIVGISGFTVRPARARREKPRVSAFTSAKIDRILDLQPDFVVGFSDIQADIAQALIKAGVEVWISNHRSVEGILGYVRRLGALVGVASRADQLALELERHVELVRLRSNGLARRPRVYFEEWDEPMISGIRWVSELIGIAGGDDVFPERALCGLARDRILPDPSEVIRRAPDIILGSWCGKRFRPERVAQRPNWQDIPAVRTGELHEIKSPLILQPGPAALTDGLDAIQQILWRWGQQYAATPDTRLSRCLLLSPVTSAPPSPVPSPCIGVCQLNAQQLCTGCHRYLDEIAEWSRASSARRIEIRCAAALRAAADANRRSILSVSPSPPDPIP
jgi:iron complex transport system substrate-binding protein